MVDRFIGVDVINSQFSCAEGASVSDLFAVRWTDANLSFYLGWDTVKKAVSKIPACKNDEEFLIFCCTGTNTGCQEKL